MKSKDKLCLAIFGVPFYSWLVLLHEIEIIGIPANIVVSADPIEGEDNLIAQKELVQQLAVRQIAIQHSLRKFVRSIEIIVQLANGLMTAGSSRRCLRGISQAAVYLVPLVPPAPFARHRSHGRQCRGRPEHAAKRSPGLRKAAS